MMMKRAWLVCVVCAACGSSDAPRGNGSGSGRVAIGSGAGAVGSGAIAMPATPAPVGSGAVVVPAPPAQLLDGVPSDAAYAFIAELAPAIDAAVPQLDLARLRAAATARLATPDPIARAGYAALVELANAAANPAPVSTLGLTGRVAIYDAGPVPLVIRLEATPAGAATVARVMARAGQAGASPWLVERGNRALLVAAADYQIVVAYGPRALVRAQAAALVGPAASPLTPAALVALGSDHGLDPRAVGWLDPPRLAAVAVIPGAVAALDDVTPACRVAVIDALAAVPRVAFGVAAASHTSLHLAATLDISPALGAALGSAADAAPTLPDALAGAPLVAIGYVAPPSGVLDPWTARQAKLTAACGADVVGTASAANKVSAAALEIYAAKWRSIIPTFDDALVALQGHTWDDLLGLFAGAITLPALADGGPFQTIHDKSIAEVVPGAQAARRGRALVVAAGAKAHAHAADLAPHAGASFGRLYFDVAALVAAAAGAQHATDDDAFYRGADDFAADAGLDAVLRAWVRTADVRVTATPVPAAIRLDASAELALTRVPVEPPDPRAKIRDQCAAIFAHALAAAAPAIAKLGLTDDERDELAGDYRGSWGADRAMRACAKLTAPERACLAAANDPLTDVTCVKSQSSDFGEELDYLPPLIDELGAHSPLDRQLHPKVDGAAIVKQLAGTWKRESSGDAETWVVAGTAVTITKGASTEHQTLRADVAGKLVLAHGDETSTEPFWGLAADRFYAGGSSEVAPNADPQHALIATAAGYFVRDGARCWVITLAGALVDATCAPSGAHDVAVTYTPPCRAAPCERVDRYTFLPGWIVRAGMAEDRDAFMRVK